MNDLVKPSWLKIRPPKEMYTNTKKIVKKSSVATVCEEAHCPNLPECWSCGTATFMIMGDTCTRACKFCNVKTGFPGQPLDSREPEKLARAAKEMGLEYIVITSVDRDDLKDQGSGHFAECIQVLKDTPDLRIEVLIPDFKGDPECLKKVVLAKPDVIGHNIETVERLQNQVRDPRASYGVSLDVLKNVKEMDPRVLTKSSIMVGLGESKDEIMKAMKDLRAVNVDFLTIGQYLRPSKKHLPVREYVKPEVFEYYESSGKNIGFKGIVSGPFVRSSYKAAEIHRKFLSKEI